jgi:hypothetical protein
MGWVVNATPWTLYPRERDLVPTVQEAGWIQGRSGWVQKISPPPWFDPRTVQPIASRYTDYAIPTQLYHTAIIKFITIFVFYVLLLSNVKCKVSMSFIEHHVVKMYRWVEAQFHTFSTFTTRWRLVANFMHQPFYSQAKVSVNTYCIVGWLVLKNLYRWEKFLASVSN